MSDEWQERHHLPPNQFNPHAWLIGEPTIGSRCWIGAFTVIDGSGGLTIGDGCEISAGAQIYTHSTVRRVIAGEGVPDRAPTSIGDAVHVGAGAIILRGCTVGSHVVIGAGTVVPEFTMIPDWSLVVGVPARIIPDGARKFSAEGSAAEQSASHRESEDQ